ncbi:MAG TPA: hypothetical protein PK313_00765 [Myxococcota bacterium]|nr:hypothetical protein [Myxococcota bacterium]
MPFARRSLPILCLAAALAASCGGGDGPRDAAGADGTDATPDATDVPDTPDAETGDTPPDTPPVDPVYPEACLGALRPSGPDCGAIRRQGCCDADGRVVWCERGALYCADCALPGAGGACGWKDLPAFTGYDCGGDGVDPLGIFPGECGRACVPDCADGAGGTRACGPDGCGGVCGDCAPGDLCDGAGACVPPPGGEVVGRLEYEARVPVFDPLEGPSLDPAPVVLPAAGLPVTVSDAGGVVLGRGTAAADGAFRIPVARSPEAGDRLVFAALGAGPAGPLFAVVRPDAGGAARSGTWPAWAWTRELDGADAGTIRVTQAQGAGAIHLFRLAALAVDGFVARMAGGDATQVVPLALAWAPGVSWDCGYCYAARTPQVPADGVHLADSVFIDGHADGSSAWAAAAVLHEVGHAALRNLSRNDSPGGSHAVGDLLVPPFAWAEGWTNFFGVSAHSRFLGLPDARLWAIVPGIAGSRVAFWMDFAEGLGDAAGTHVPDPDAGMDQPLDERWVAAVLWDLWDRADVDDLERDASGVLDTDAMDRALVSRRMLRGDRGAAGADLVDFLDALVCDDPDVQDAMRAVVPGDPPGFPWDGAAACR